MVLNFNHNQRIFHYPQFILLYMELEPELGRESELEPEREPEPEQEPVLEY